MVPDRRQEQQPRQHHNVDKLVDTDDRLRMTRLMKVYRICCIQLRRYFTDQWPNQN